MAVNRDWAPRVGGGPHCSGKLVPMSGKLMEKFYKGLHFQNFPGEHAPGPP